MSAVSCDCDDTCSDMLGVLFEKNSDWADGTYDLDLELDGDAVRCTFRVPSRGWPIDHCDDDDRTTATQGGLSHDGTPSSVALTLSLQQTVLVSTTFAPEYEAPRDWDRVACGAPCDIGSETVQVP